MSYGGRDAPRVRSLPELRGRYGLSEERFETLEEGPRDRKAGTVVGRQQRPAALKFEPAERSLMGTARLPVPPEVEQHQEQDEPVEIPMVARPRWGVVALIAVLAVGVLFVALRRDAVPAKSATEVEEESSLPMVPNKRAATSQATAAPSEPEREAAAPAATAVDSPASASAPEAEASADASARRNGLPEFPELDHR